MDIKRSGAQPSGKGPAEWFTGTVRIDPLFQAPDPARVVGASVTFEPGARTAWHTHPLGQTLIVTAGCGRAQRWGGPIEEIRPGDVIWFAPGEKHWHGATATTAITHIAIVERLGDKTADWMEKVSDEGMMTDKTDKKVWFVTGAGRGMGVDFAMAALAAGYAVVATGRDTDAVANAVGKSDDLLVVKLDVTNGVDAAAAARAAVDRFGRIDVLVNNAANFFAGYFEELTPEQIERKVKTALIGPMNVTRAVLPVMRKQRSGHIISISSGAGLLGFAFCSAYAASKFGLEGWMESLQQEVAPFGITTTIVNPGFFRTELLAPASVTYAEPSVADYAGSRADQLKWWQAQSGRQPGDPAKLARALIAIASEEQPPRRFIAGADAIGLAEQKVADLKAQIDAYRELSTSLSLDELAPAGSAR